MGTADSAAASPARDGRGVLDGAFTVLEALAQTEEGLGLTALARQTGLAKTTAHRLAEQLVATGAAQRLDHRYFVGPLIGRLGRCWQPDPRLRRASYQPVRTLATLTHAAASMYVLHDGRARLVIAAVPRGESWVPSGDTNAESTPFTAVGRALLATQHNRPSPDCPTAQDWRRMRACVDDLCGVVTDNHEAAHGICCVAAPVWLPDGRCAAAVAALVLGPKVPPGLNDLVTCAARQIGHNLQ
ncbi:helix-turn-helix domain-containing protein [Rhodococcus spelaei]|nr:helix-turn-helix domain-containing protein [Rhodococcus spelaei]